MATIVFLMLLALLGTGMLMIAREKAQVTNELSAHEIAKANARLAINLALADLQSHLGDDRRITADADVLNPQSTNPRLLGVWRGDQLEQLENPLTPVQRAEVRQRRSFLTWLVSHPQPEARTEQNFAEQAPGSRSVPLFQARSDGFDLTGERIPLQNPDGTPGAYAWAVTQEATKAKINIGGNDTHPEGNAAIQAPLRPYLGNSQILQHPDNNWNEHVAALLSPRQVALNPVFGIDAINSGQISRDFTTYAQGVFADVTAGGLKTDLSLAFELSDQAFNRPTLEDVPNPFRGGSSPNNEVPLFAPINSASPVNIRVDYGSATFDHRLETGGVPTFDKLRSHYRLHKHLYLSNGSPTAFIRPSLSNWWDGSPPSTTGVAPVLNRVLIFFSVWIDPEGLANIVLTPVITLWNPYNVALESPGYILYPWLDMPVFAEWDIFPRGGGRIFQRVPLSETVVAGFGGGRQVNPYFFCEITARGNGMTNLPVRLEPGEVRVFAPSSPNPIRFQRNAGDPIRTLRMRPVNAPEDLLTEGGFALRMTDGIRHHINHRFGPGDRLRLGGEFGADRFHYHISLEDAGRISRGDPRVLAQVQVYSGFGREGVSQRVATPFFTAEELMVRPRPYAVLETFNRTAAEQGRQADLLYTVNPRQRLVTNLVSNSQFTTGPHYETNFRPVADIVGAAFQVTADGQRSYHGASNEAFNGRDRIAFFDIPQQSLISLGGFQHADLTDTAFAPANAFGNAWASPYLASTEVASLLRNASSTAQEPIRPAPGLAIYDHSYLLNQALWDRYFISSLSPDIELTGAPGSTRIYQQEQARETRSLRERANAWLTDPISNPLKNTRILPYRSGMADSQMLDEISGPAGCVKAPGHMLLDGPFNINSTSVEAWKAILASQREQSIDWISPTLANQTSQPSSQTPFPRNLLPSGAEEDIWSGFRVLTDAQIQALAENIVEQVQQRGPFLSVADFVNRRAERSSNGADLKGALQMAIDSAAINRDSRVERFDTTAFLHGQNIPDAFTGVGLPGWLTQADVLNGLGAYITARSDTFIIRAMGEARAADGTLRARVLCEAVVQRVPTYVDPSQPPHTRQEQLNPTNAQFGRRFKIISFRYLNPLT